MIKPVTRHALTIGWKLPRFRRGPMFPIVVIQRRRSHARNRDGMTRNWRWPTDAFPEMLKEPDRYGLFTRRIRFRSSNLNPCRTRRISERVYRGRALRDFFSLRVPPPFDFQEHVEVINATSAH